MYNQYTAIMQIRSSGRKEFSSNRRNIYFIRQIMSFFGQL